VPKKHRGTFYIQISGYFQVRMACKSPTARIKEIDRGQEVTKATNNLLTPRWNNRFLYVLPEYCIGPTGTL
jgi:hypothetical protein